MIINNGPRFTNHTHSIAECHSFNYKDIGRRTCYTNDKNRRMSVFDTAESTCKALCSTIDNCHAYTMLGKTNPANTCQIHTAPCDRKGGRNHNHRLNIKTGCTQPDREIKGYRLVIDFCIGKIERGWTKA